DSGIIIGKRGTTLDAIQFLLNIMIDPKIKGNKKIIVDIESYRDKRELALVRLGRSIANSVAKTGRSRLLEPMNPYERRIIHIALQKDERVFTRSEGTGTFKRVRIISVRERHKYKDLEDQVEQVSETEEEEDEES
ncbi:MAG: RNA-binding protein, partial [Leptospiraceae bacterium]|nr:RNA-binding protein [Leptospiraceae bacterium]